MKPGNTPQYVNVKSNHPPAIIKSIPEGINKRLAQISSDEDCFKNAAQPYQEALRRNGYEYELTYKRYNRKRNENTEKKRRRNVTWYNPPFDVRVKTNVARRFLKIVDDSFPAEHPLRKIFNRNTLKVSYSCTPNVQSIIDGHNKKKLQSKDDTNKTCNCRDKAGCPLQGHCRQSSVIYQATVHSQEQQEGNSNHQHTEKYVGLTDTEFKLRLANHKQSFTKSNLRNSTELSKYVWSLKDRAIRYNITWKILDRASAYNNKSKKCNLCNLEKYYIMCHRKEATLNQRCGLVSSCRHSNKYTLSNHPT